ncbi:DNA alkylation repair protein [Cohnella cellulosilytica]|uniref:DNA alkylation repair protein n=1 Tax=Cohnella cellulosilytica TaxID=986710 RepID=A0ABW2F2X8_9BACL
MENAGMDHYTAELAAWLRSHADPAKAAPMAAYMRNKFPFLGLKTPERTRLIKAFWAKHGVPAGDELLDVVKRLWELPEREFQNAALAFLDKRGKRAGKEDIDVVEHLIVTKPWWDTVDYLASNATGDLLAKYPELIPAYADRWIASDDLWLRRTALLYQLRYKERTDVGRLFAYIERCKDEREFFIRKAIGWALREYSKTDEDAVRRFVERTPLSPLSAKEALKHVSR